MDECGCYFNHHKLYSTVTNATMLKLIQKSMENCMMIFFLCCDNYEINYPMLW